VLESVLKLKKIAITGCLATGKSSLCSIFQELGAYCVSADQIVHQLLLPLPSLDTQHTEKKITESRAIRERVVLLLGNQIIVDGNIDRKKVAEIVFQSPEKLKELEQILHPHVKDEIVRMYEQVLEGKEGKEYSLFVVEIPLFFELLNGAWQNFQQWFDYTVCLTASEDVAVNRFIKKTGYTKEEYKKRAGFQMSQDEKAKRADFVLTNEGTLEDLKKSANRLYQKLIKIS
jgi:dephospho-CoA kinase